MLLNFLHKKIIIIIFFLLILPAINSKPTKINQESTSMDSNNVIFQDDFNNKSDQWHWVIKHNAKVNFNNGIAELKIPKAYRFGHFDAEIITNETDPYRYNTFETRIKVDPVLKGSRGWGFWNWKYKKSECELAWFIYQEGYFWYPLKGLWVQCVDGNIDNMTLIKITGYDLSEWHDYKINWEKEYVEFFVDDTLVANVTKGIPKTNCRVDVWIDNANWLMKMPFPVYIPILNKFQKETTLYLDYIRITD